MVLLLNGLLFFQISRRSFPSSLYMYQLALSTIMDFKMVLVPARGGLHCYNCCPAQQLTLLLCFFTVLWSLFKNCIIFPLPFLDSFPWQFSLFFRLDGITVEGNSRSDSSRKDVGRRMLIRHILRSFCPFPKGPKKILIPPVAALIIFFVCLLKAL